MKFSPSTGCFYPPDLTYVDVPDDLIECTQAEYDAATARQLGELLAVVGGKVVVLPVPGPTLDQARADATERVQRAYQAARSVDIAYNGATFQADEGSIDNLLRMLQAFAGGPVPAGFAWIAANNTPVPFTYADMQGLARAIGTRAYAAFVQMQTRKAAIRAATTAAAALAVEW